MSRFSIIVCGALGLAFVSCNGSSSGGSDTAAATSTAGSSSESGPAGPFAFDSTPPEGYTQVDRAAMPGVATALITSQDEYNAATPKADADGTYEEEIRANLTGFHGLVDDDIMELGLTPCEIEVCLAQVLPAVVPDMIAIDPAMPSAFPNGRPLDTQVMDLTLAVLLLDLSVESPTSFADIPMNPPKNDKEFLAEFPYLAEPHE